MEEKKTELAGSLEEKKTELAGSLEEKKTELATKKSELDAYREYKSAASKHLYQHFEPIMFLFYELSDSAYSHIILLAKAAKGGLLDADKGLLSKKDSYHLQISIYRLLAPIARIQNNSG